MKKPRRKWKARLTPAQHPIKEWQVVLAELKPGTASVGIRFNQEDTVHFFRLNLDPTEAVKVVASIAQGEITLQDIAEYDWRAVTMPYKQEAQGEQVSPDE